jgi:hypothetical protein
MSKLSPAATEDKLARLFDVEANVCLWHLADIDGGDEYVCFQV